MEIKQAAATHNGAKQDRLYYLVSDFNKSNQSDWQQLRSFCKPLAAANGHALVVSFMDLSQHYEPSPIGELIGQPYYERVIAQFIITVLGGKMFISDPMGAGYEEPGREAADFSI